jgi:hypothetical protein
MADSLHDLREIDVVFDGPPGPECGRFVEVEDPNTGHSMNVGEWIERPDGLWVLRLWVSSRASVNAG